MKPWEQKPTWYAGVGSRQTPILIANKMRAIAERLRGLGWTLRSGGAQGADQAFHSGAHPKRDVYEVGSRRSTGHRVLVLRADESCDYVPVNQDVTAAAERIACFHHPHWHVLGAFQRMLHARNVIQVLGDSEPDLLESSTRSAFVLCWTPDGATLGEETTERTGGTGQAIRVASYHNIPVYNLQREDHLALWLGLLGDVNVERR